VRLWMLRLEVNEEEGWVDMLASVVLTGAGRLDYHMRMSATVDGSLHG
jgi:hypothetical protein